MSRFAKLPLALLAVLAMLFLMPGLARADDGTPPADSCAADPTGTGCPAAGTGADAGTAAGSGDQAAPTGSDPGGAGQPPVTDTQPDGAAPNPVTDVPPPCTDPTSSSDCIAPCALDAFEQLPVCTPTPPAPATNCDGLPDLPGCAAGGPVAAPAPSPKPAGSGDDVYYKNCDDARAHGATNIRRGEPGYRPALDRDDDGIACETSTSTGTPETSAPRVPAPHPPTARTPEPQTPTLQAAAAPVVDRLAYTGAVPAPMTAAGLGLVLGGAALLRLGRRTR